MIKYSDLNKERGSSLILTMLLLLILTVMALGETRFNSTQTRIAANGADALIAFQSAEGALNQATSAVLKGLNDSTDFLANNNGLYMYNATNAPIWTTVNWNSGSAVIQSYQGNSSKKAAYIIEQLPYVTKPGQSMSRPTAVYRITARGVGASGNSPVMLQSVVLVPQ